MIGIGVLIIVRILLLLSEILELRKYIDYKKKGMMEAFNFAVLFNFDIYYVIVAVYYYYHLGLYL